MSENLLTKQIRLYITKCGGRVFRNNVGQSWIGAWLLLWSGDVLIKNPRRFTSGLCEGSSDLIGWMPDGRFLAIEVKSKRGRLSKAQRNFLDAVNRFGGVGIEARTLDDVKQIMEAI